MKKSQKIENKILDHQKILNLRQTWMNEGKKVVFTNGCFDIIHKGHIDYLSKSADLGDILIVGLNSDDSVRRLKGKNRPLQDENSRSIILAAMVFVDYVILFHEDTPYELIKTTRPDILVKGADYKAEDIVGYDIVTSSGGKVVTIDFLEGYSTTSVIDKLQ